eukprot:942570-Alexandrium_andersonii.AAC.1
MVGGDIATQTRPSRARVAVSFASQVVRVEMAIRSRLPVADGAVPCASRTIAAPKAPSEHRRH